MTFRDCLNARRPLPVIGALAAVAVTLSACGSTGGVATNDFKLRKSHELHGAPSARRAGMPTSGLAARLAVKQDWLTVFSSATPASLRMMMLQNGQQFAGALKKQAGSGFATAKVTRVELSSPQQARVTYGVSVAGHPAEGSRTGTAVYQNGTWKVSAASFCGLLQAEHTRAASSLPPACSGG